MNRILVSGPVQMSVVRNRATPSIRAPEYGVMLLVRAKVIASDRPSGSDDDGSTDCRARYAAVRSEAYVSTGFRKVARASRMRSVASVMMTPA